MVRAEAAQACGALGECTLGIGPADALDCRMGERFDLAAFQDSPHDLRKPLDADIRTTLAIFTHLTRNRHDKRLGHEQASRIKGLGTVERRATGIGKRDRLREKLTEKWVTAALVVALGAAAIC